jgi:hypothetical protein
MPKKTPKAKGEAPEKQATLVKLSELSKTEIAKVNFDDLWLMRPEKTALPARPRRYCGCRGVCLV